jgi:aromatic ring-opening dioxygenase catalytic subunit (LigB family)
MPQPIGLAPVHFFSHGSTAMLGEESKSADYWKACGDAALANGIKHVVIMVSFFAPFAIFILASAVALTSVVRRT